MSELSTRIWLDERLWAALRQRAIAEGVTIAELIPRLVQQTMTAPSGVRSQPAAAPAPAPTPEQSGPDEGDLPTAVLSPSYRCAVCGAEVRLGGLSNHLGKHLKERAASEAERS
jgi:hypothetical protein